MSQFELPTSEIPEWNTFDVDTRADKMILEVLHSSTLTRVGQLLEWSHDKSIGVTLQKIKQDLTQWIFDFDEYNIRLRLLPQEIQHLIIRTAYICGKTTGKIFGNLAAQASKDHHLNWFNDLIFPKDVTDLLGTLMRFETHGRIESVIYAIQEWKESQEMVGRVDWGIIHDASDLFYWACEKNHITKADVAEFLGAYGSSL